MLPLQLTTKHLIDGECEVPETLFKFHNSVNAGENYRKKIIKTKEQFNQQ